MPVAVMIFGGKRDGSIFEVQGHLVPDKRYMRFTIPPPPVSLTREPEFQDTVPESKVITLEITPRRAATGPAWKLELPKELW